MIEHYFERKVGQILRLTAHAKAELALQMPDSPCQREYRIEIVGVEASGRIHALVRAQDLKVCAWATWEGALPLLAEVSVLVDPSQGVLDHLRLMVQEADPIFFDTHEARDWT